MSEILVAGAYPGTYFDKVKAMQDKEALKTKSNVWMSRPRTADSKVQEVLYFDFADRSSISNISLDVLSIGVTYEFWYRDSNNKRLPLLRNTLDQIKFTTKSSKTPNEWQHWSFDCTPCIVKQLELRMERVNDELAPKNEYSIGIRKLGIRRDIHNRKQAALAMHDSIDILGNVISHTVKDWQPEYAIDDSTKTFWKSEPQISQDAVVCLYLDMRDKYGQAQYVDNLALDPVYTGSQMNVYYSTDDTVGKRLTPFAAYDFTSENTEWNKTHGLSMEQDNANVVMNLLKTQIDKHGSWTMSMDWFPTKRPNENEVIFHMDGVMHVTQTEQGFIFRVRTANGMKDFKLDYPNDIEVFRKMPIELSKETEIRLTFGVERDDKEKLHANCRIINWNTPIGDIKEYGIINDKQTSIDIPFGMELSATANGMLPLYEPKTRKGITFNKADKEIAIEPNNIWNIPIEKSLDMLPLQNIDNDDMQLELDIKYRTDEKYIWGARLQYDNPEDNKVRWWVGNKNASASRLAINSKLICTNSFWDPLFDGDGRWLPEQFDGTGRAYKENASLVIEGQGRCRNLTQPASFIWGSKSYVFSAIPTFNDDIEWYRDFKLYVYDGKAEQYVATPTAEAKSGERLTISFTAPEDAHLLSFGFVGGNKSSDKVVWSKPMLCTKDDWERLNDLGLDWFEADTVPTVQRMMQRKSNEICLNPKFNTNLPMLGQPAAPYTKEKYPFDGNCALLNPGYNTYDLPAEDNWILAKGGSSFAFSFYLTTDNGFSRPQPYIEDTRGNKFYPDKYIVGAKEHGWQLVYARVSVPNNHVEEYMSFGFLQHDILSFAYIGDLHIYDNSNAFSTPQRYNTERVSITIKNGKITAKDASKFYIANMSNAGTIYVSSWSIKAKANTISPLLGYDAKIGKLNGVLTGFNIKQASPKTLTEDKFLQDPKRYLSPDSYDAQSTMTDSLVYAKFYEENAVRGGVPDSLYTSKIWTPMIVGAKLEKQTYFIPSPTRVKYLKLEFTQLTPIQYPLEQSNIKQTYAVFPKDVVKELEQKYKDTSTSNGKQSPDGDMQAITSRVTQQFEANASVNTNKLASTNWNQYWHPDITVLNGKVPIQYMPGGWNNPVYDILTTETTSSSTYTGTGEVTAEAVSSSQSVTARQQNMYAANYMIYDAFASDDLLGISRQYDLKDWAYKFDTSAYADDNTTKVTMPGKMPGYWVLPGQMQFVSNSNIRKILSTAKVDIARKGLAKTPTNAVIDTRTALPTMGIIGPKCFSHTGMHWYDYITETRTQSLAYVVAIRDIKIRVVDFTAMHDNTAWKLYSMGLPIWHFNGGYLTDKDIFVPDFSTGNDVAVAQTDPMTSQSYFRTIKILSTNRDSLCNRYYFPLGDTEAWHAPDYWYQHPELQCTWADSTPPDKKILEDNGGAWASTRFSWGETWTNSIVTHKEWNVWYDGELVKHVIVKPEERQFDKHGKQVPFILTLGETFVPKLTMAKLGSMLCSLKRANANGKPCECRLQLMAGRFGSELVIDEKVDFNDTKLGIWQKLETSRQKLMDMKYKCRVLLYLNNFEELDFYVKAAYIETGTMLIEARNTQRIDNTDWEDITSAVGRKDSIYTFKQIGNNFQLRISMFDPQDWFSSIVAIPVYIPYEDAIDWHYDRIRSCRIVTSDGNQLPKRIPVGTTIALGTKVVLHDGKEDDHVHIHDVMWKSSNREIARVNRNNILEVRSAGDVDIYASIDGIVSEPTSLDCYWV